MTANGGEVDASSDPPKAVRTDVTKTIWAYIRENDLQNPNDKRQIVCDGVLKGMFGVDCVTMFSMNKYIGPHIQNKAGEWGTRPSDDLDPSAIPKATKRKKKEPRKKTASGFQKEVAISSELAAFMKLDTPMASRPQVVKRIWEHIKAKDLQNPDNRREIVCDAALRTLLKQDKVTMFSINKFLKVHFV